MTHQFFAEYRAIRDQRKAVKDSNRSGFLWGNLSGMIILLGMIFALAQFGIRIG